MQGPFPRPPHFKSSSNGTPQQPPLGVQGNSGAVLVRKAANTPLGCFSMQLISPENMCGGYV